MVIVDSSVWIGFLNGTDSPQTNWLAAAIGKKEIALTSLILCEVLQGIDIEAQFRATERELLRFPVFDTLDTRLVTASAQNYRTLRRKGITIRKTIDCLIATFCIENGFSLLHNDRDFNAFEQHMGLVAIDPLAQPLN